jgi:hypothetical protein
MSTKPAERYREMRYAEAAQRAARVLSDGYGEALILQDPTGYWGLYYLFGLAGYHVPPPDAVPDWVEGPRPDPCEFQEPYRVRGWLEESGYLVWINESK